MCDGKPADGIGFVDTKGMPIMTPEEAEELAALWTGAQGSVAAFVRTFVRRGDESEEILQRTAMALVRKFSEYDRSRPFVAWAIGVSKHEVLAYWRQQHADRHVFDLNLVERITESHCRLAERHLPISDMVAQCVDQLDGRAMEAIHLRYGKQCKVLQIAEMMKLSYGAARMLLTRARNTLRLCLEEQLKRIRT